MTEAALESATEIRSSDMGRGTALRRFMMGDALFRWATFASALAVLLLLGGVIVSLIIGSLPAFDAFGFRFLTTEVWNPVTEKFGAVAPVYGTLVTSFIAMLIGIPVSLGIAIFLTELCPYWLRRPVGTAIELLAGIPSIIYGIWGLFVFAPFLQATVQPFLISLFGGIPGLSSLFAGPPYGIGMLTAGLILAIMVLPFITAVTRDVFLTAGAEGSGLRHGLHDLGSRAQGSHPIHPRRRHRRYHARPRPRPWRNHGSHLRHRQCAQDRCLDPGPRDDHFGDYRQRIQRGHGRPLSVVADCPRPDPLRHHLHRARRSSAASPSPRAEGRQMKSMALYGRRRVTSAIAMGLSLAATIFGAAWLVIILATLLWNGFSGLSLAVFTQNTPPPGSAGGLANAIVGSLFLTVFGVVVGTPIGILAGTYMAEYGRYSRLTMVIRFVNDILLSAPSIVVGLFVYEILVVSMGHFSAWAGGVALAMLVIPVVVRTTEDMLVLVPNSLRYRAARAGIVTGILLAIARITGETAPLLFTVLNNQFWSLDPNAEMANLPVTIFQFALSPYPDWQHLAWTGALIVTFAVLVLNIVARLLTSIGTSK
jgi:phosphate transport system permease protein